ncbi:MAG: hypothetical protein A2428_02450 [Bdellovibrionales bacterium RIFOXYC1_FULL_54_43]|nr:MAG: hypothetical protein A2428_02450 [Bdellovibrionales bacterium RIFOXYC1_FULL_54_43]OFZ80436.1 MAG: hypothetical protein A2603_08265 [Bdellovibrionales bacterium RIFOXYD1_FULL_55_31]
MSSSGVSWNGFLEALHSAWIDELTERYPEPKPTLGMPIRAKGFVSPSEGVLESLAISVTLSASPGWVVLAGEPALDLRSIWTGVQRRAQAEFARRSISPAFGEPAFSAGGATFPPAARVIWIPIELGASKKCFLGFGA